MKKYILKVSICIYILLLGVLSMYVWHSTSPKSVKAATASKAEAVIEVQTGRILFKNNADCLLPMASTTKVLTAIVILEDCNLQEVITVGKNTVGIEGSSIYLKENDKLTIEDLLYGLMLRSGNDCAETLAMHHSKSLQAFAKVMTERAKKMGAVNSCFANPHGLPQDGHFTTAEDLAKISAYAMRNATFHKIVSTKQYITSLQEGTERRVFINKNKLLYNYPCADGVKTGFTKEAGRCLVSSANKNGMQVVAVVLNSPDMYERSTELLENAFAKYSMQKVLTIESLPKEIATNIQNKKCSIGGVKDIYYPMAAGEENLFVRKVNLPQSVVLPIHAGDKIGSVEVYFQKECIAKADIFATQTVKKSFFDSLKQILHR